MERMRDEVLADLRGRIGIVLEPRARQHGIDSDRNKGWVGQTLDRLVGTSRLSAAAPDGPDWELKSGVLGPSGEPAEAAKVTAFDRTNTASFEHSVLWAKLRRGIYVGVRRTHRGTVVSAVIPFDLDDPALVARVRTDWAHLRVQRPDGRTVRGPSDLLELRPANRGHGSMAWYARKSLLRHMLAEAPTAPTVGPRPSASPRVPQAVGLRGAFEGARQWRWWSPWFDDLIGALDAHPSPNQVEAGTVEGRPVLLGRGPHGARPVIVFYGTGKIAVHGHRGAIDEAAWRRAPNRVLSSVAAALKAC
jgi:hypothetical protein